MIPANTPQKMKFSIKDFFSKCDQICSFLRTWSLLLKKSLEKKESLSFSKWLRVYNGDMPNFVSLKDPILL